MNHRAQAEPNPTPRASLRKERQNEPLSESGSVRPHQGAWRRKQVAPQAKAKFGKLLAKAEDSWAVWRGANSRWQDAYEAARRARENLDAWQAEAEQGARHLSSNAAGGTLLRHEGVRLTHDAVASGAKPYRDALAQAQAEEATRRAARDAANEAAEPAKHVVSMITQYLEKLADDAVLKDAPVPALRLKGDLLEQLKTARRSVEGLDGERLSVRNAPAADEDALAAILRAVTELAAKGRPDVSDVARGVQWPRVNADVHSANAFTVVTTPDSLAVAAWLDPDLMVERLHAEARRSLKESGRQPGLPQAHRAALVAGLDSQILEAEWAEEAVLSLLETQGHTVPRRDNAVPRGVLCITGPAPSF